MDDKTDTTSRLILKQDKLHHDWLVMSLLRHITPSSRHMMMSNALQSLLDRSFPVSGCLSGKYHVLFIMCFFFYYALSSFLSPYVICPYPDSSSDQFPSHDDTFPLSLMIHSFPLPTSFPNDLTNRSHPPSCLCFLSLFYLWYERLWSSVTATVLVLKLY